MKEYPYLKKTEPRGSILYSLLKQVIDPGESIMDLACGYAPIAKHAIKEGHPYYGVDNNPEVIQELRKMYPKGMFFNFDITTTGGEWIPVILLLGITKEPHQEYSVILFKKFRVCMLEYAEAPDSFPRIKAKEKIAEDLKERGYGLALKSHYEAELEAASKRVVEIYVKDYQPLEYYETRFKEPTFCRGEEYRKRDQILVSLLDESPRRVFEFGGASGLLGEEILKKYPRIKYYFHSDLSPLACWNAIKHMKAVSKETAIRTAPIDMIWDRPSMHSYDLVATTSMEHLPQGTDLRIIEEIEPGTTVLFSLTKFGKKGHPHPFPTEHYIRHRYRDLIDIQKLVDYPQLHVYLLKGKRT